MSIYDHNHNLCNKCYGGIVHLIDEKMITGTRFVSHGGNKFSYELKVYECDTCLHRHVEMNNFREHTSRSKR